MKFDRSVFSNKSFLNFVENDLNLIEELYDNFSKLPDKHTRYYLSEKGFIKLLSNPKKEKDALYHVIYEINSRIQFLLFTNLFKFLKYTESLIESWNSKNYLGWILFGRATIELCAVYSYFDQKLKKLDPLRTDFTVEELKEIENILIQYSHGTRFDWDALIEGDYDRLKEEFEARGEFRQAINVLTAIDKLQKISSVFYEIRIIYDMLSDFAHPNMGSHSLFIDLEEQFQDPMPNNLALCVNDRRGEFLIKGSLKPIAACLAYCGHLLKETTKIMEIWEGYGEHKSFTIRFPDTIAIFPKK